MGRYYNGDINGKFWFGTQSSDDADFFGSTGTPSNDLNYYFEKQEHLESIKKGIKQCEKELGEYKLKLDQFFKKEIAYNNKQISEELKIDETKVKELLTIYARLKLGNKILKCVQETGSCNFTAEC